MIDNTLTIESKLGDFHKTELQMTRELPQENKIVYDIESVNVIKPVKFLESAKPEEVINLLRLHQLISKSPRKLNSLMIKLQMIQVTSVYI